jgi:undecaprenyl diphosphate synthase
LTRHNTGLQLTIAMGYSGRQDLVGAVQQIAAAVAAGQLQPQQVRLGASMVWNGSSMYGASDAAQVVSCQRHPVVTVVRLWDQQQAPRRWAGE